MTEHNIPRVLELLSEALRATLTTRRVLLENGFPSGHGAVRSLDAAAERIAQDVEALRAFDTIRLPNEEEVAEVVEENQVDNR